MNSVSVGVDASNRRYCRGIVIIDEGTECVKAECLYGPPVEKYTCNANLNTFYCRASVMPKHIL